MASDCSIRFYVENSSHEFFISQILNSQEERFGVQIYKNGTRIWCGTIQADGIEKTDIYYPYPVMLRFVDGLGRLSDKYYNQTGLENSLTPFTGRQTLLQHIVNCLSYTGTLQYFGTFDPYIKTCSRFFETRHTSYLNDPLTNTNLSHLAFYNINEEGKYEWKTCQDVLVNILECFNLTIKQAGGFYHIIQNHEYANPTLVTWGYTKSGSLVGVTNGDTTLKIQSTTLNRMTGGVYKYFPPLQQVKKKYKYAYSPGFNGNMLPVQSDYSTAVDFINSVAGGNLEVLHFTGTIREVWTSPNTNPVVGMVASYKMKIVLTTPYLTYYLNGVPGNTTWETNPNSYVVLDGGWFLGSYNGVNYTQWELNTPAIITGGTATFELDFYQYTRPLASGESMTFTCENFFIELLGDTGEYSGDKTYIVINTSLPTSTSKIEVKETVVGDGPYLYNVGAMQTYNGSSWNMSTAWYYATPPVPSLSNPINRLAIQQNLAGQTLSCEQYQGSFTGAYSAEKAIVWGSKIFVPLQVEFNAVLDLCLGIWFNAAIPAFNPVYDE
jgi:hypothetical protein